MLFAPGFIASETSPAAPSHRLPANDRGSRSRIRTLACGRASPLDTETRSTTLARERLSCVTDQILAFIVDHSNQMQRSCMSLNGWGSYRCRRAATGIRRSATISTKTPLARNLTSACSRLRLQPPLFLQSEAFLKAQEGRTSGWVVPRLERWRELQPNSILWWLTAPTRTAAK